MKYCIDRELNIHDLIVVASSSYICIGVLKSVADYSMHFYPLTANGVAKAKKAGGYISFINTPRPSRIFKITAESLEGDELKYYKEIMEALEGKYHVATADNT